MAPTASVVYWSRSAAFSSRTCAMYAAGGCPTVLTNRSENAERERLHLSANLVFAKPTKLSFPEAANLLLVGTTAAEMLHVTAVGTDDVVLLHGAAGAVGTSALQQARLIGATVIGTASKANFDEVARFGGVPVDYGPGLEERVSSGCTWPGHGRFGHRWH